MAEIEAFDPYMLVFLDETGSDKRNSIHQFGYGLRGITPVTHKLDIYGKRISAIGVMTTRGMGTFFLQFVQTCLLNIIQPFDGNNARFVVVMDNASIHHVDAVVELITAAGALVQFLPPYRVRT